MTFYDWNINRDPIFIAGELKEISGQFVLAIAEGHGLLYACLGAGESEFELPGCHAIEQHSAGIFSLRPPSSTTLATCRPLPTRVVEHPSTPSLA
jgi:hypothetical protein